MPDPADSLPEESESEESASDSTVALDLTFFELVSPPPPLPGLLFEEPFFAAGGGGGGAAVAAPFFLSTFDGFVGAFEFLALAAAAAAFAPLGADLAAAPAPFDDAAAPDEPAPPADAAPPFRALTSLRTPGGRPPVPAAAPRPLPPVGVALEVVEGAESPEAILRALAGGEETEGELPPLPFFDDAPPALPEGGRPRRFSPALAGELFDLGV